VLYDHVRDGDVNPFKLTPGTYLISFSYNEYKIGPVSGQGTVELKAGHVYRVEKETCYVAGVLLGKIFRGACTGRSPYTATLWIEDETTGEVVAGEKWD